MQKHWTEKWGKKKITVHKYPVESYPVFAHLFLKFLFNRSSPLQRLTAVFCPSGHYWLAFRKLSTTLSYGWVNRKIIPCIWWPK